MEGAYTSEGFGGRSVFTHQTHPDTQPDPPPPAQPCPPEPVTLAGETQGQRPGVNLEVVVPDWLSDLTDRRRPYGRYGQRSEVKDAIKKSADLLEFGTITAAQAHTRFNVV
ncbi:hypothetical protein KUCAC02_007968 [Chaenocephalus aceratus]|uniref:Uncharacterized protein n=1 Tax=Chaenocephalus aceratus TaxID=36190 RepID=A0ACB9X930_CHAAC|nr:hypothetical protein KUCAC02_007968 [Chaenocephalus aceratus]